MLRARFFWNVVLSLALVLLTTGVLWAADDHGEKKGEAGKLDIFHGALDLALWTIVVFVLLFFILSKYAWKPMLEGLNKREQSIRGAVEEAKIARAETERLKAEFTRELEAAHQQIPKLMEEARRKAQELAEEMRAKA